MTLVSSAWTQKDAAYKELVHRFADGRPLCNCQEAYYTPCGKGWCGQRRIEVTDLLICKDGCDINKLNAKYEIADRVLKILKGTDQETTD